MATPLQNLQMAQALFEPLGQTFSRSQNARLQMALGNLRRVQELEDQSRAAAASDRRFNLEDRRMRDLANLQRETQLEIEGSRATRDDDKAKAQERKAVKQAVREAFEKYRQVNGKQKLDEFGDEENIDTYYKIVAEVGRLEGESLNNRIAAEAESLRVAKERLSSLTDPTKEEREGAEAMAVAAMSAADKDAEKFYSKTAAKRGPQIALKETLKQYPQAAAVYNAALNQGLGTIRAEKAKSPEFVRTLTSLANREAALFSDVRDPRKTPFLGEAALTALQSLNPPQVEAPAVMADPGKTNFSPTAATPDGAPAAAVAAPQAPRYDTGILGFTERAARELPNLVDLGRLGLSYAAEVPAGGMNWMLGGMKRVREADAERQAEREALVRAFNLRNPQNPLTARPIW